MGSIDSGLFVGYDEPNRISELYRNHVVMQPHQLIRHLDFIEVAEDSSTILGAADLSGRLSTGSLWYYLNPSLAPDRDLCEVGVNFNSPACDGKFIDANKTIVVGEDSGCVTIIRCVEHDYEPAQLIPTVSYHDHSAPVVSLSISCFGNMFITGSYDLSIKVWDPVILTPVHTYGYAHGHLIQNVAFSNYDEEIFASCGLDGNVILWDFRQPVPATGLYYNPDGGMCGMAWQYGESHTLFVGSVFGTISIFDIRMPGGKISESLAFTRQVHRLLSIESRLLVGCADSHAVKIFDPVSENFALKYTDERHDDFVRGLAYHSGLGNLYSCGWDHKVVTHDLTSLFYNGMLQ